LVNDFAAGILETKPRIVVAYAWICRNPHFGKIKRLYAYHTTAEDLPWPILRHLLLIDDSLRLAIPVGIPAVTPGMRHLYPRPLRDRQSAKLFRIFWKWRNNDNGRGIWVQQSFFSTGLSRVLDA
jgi:hypothetical protein